MLQQDIYRGIVRSREVRPQELQHRDMRIVDLTIQIGIKRRVGFDDDAGRLRQPFEPHESWDSGAPAKIVELRCERLPRGSPLLDNAQLPDGDEARRVAVGN